MALAIQSGIAPNGLTPNIRCGLSYPTEETKRLWDEAQRKCTMELCKISLQHYAATIKREKEVQSGLQSQLQHALQISSLADIAFLQRRWNDETKAAFQQAQVESRRQADIRRNREKRRKRPWVDQSPTHS